MMFNGLVMCTDSDSDFTKESIGRSSEVDSPSSSCASARAQYYHNKLLATLQILQNKEETIRVQTESLEVAEARIASLTARSTELKKEIERKNWELKTLKETLQASKKETSDACITAQVQEIDNQKKIVTTLQNNLDIIEDLYKECFYETAKQEGLIEMLRKSYLDVRLMDKEKSDQISRLHNVINTQKWSLEKCQDIASDVDNLKVEISNFLNNSNNDSGVWEESLAGDLTEDLQDIAGQLLRLGELLTGDCTCGLEEENRRLKQSNQCLQNGIDDQRQKITDLENIVENKKAATRQYLEQIRQKEHELQLVQKQLCEVECESREREQAIESIEIQLHQTQELLNNKGVQLTCVQTQCQNHLETIRQLKEELDKPKERDCTCGLDEENRRLRQSNQCMQSRVDDLRQKIADLENIVDNKNAAVRQHLEQIRAKENELLLVRKQLCVVECESREREQESESIKTLLHQTRELLNGKSAQLACVQSQCQNHVETIRHLKEELDKSKENVKSECTCGLEEENRRLRQSNQCMENRLDDLRQKITDLENIVDNKNATVRQHLELIREKENELLLVQKQLCGVECESRAREQANESIKTQLNQTQELLDKKTAEMVCLQTQCQKHVERIQRLNEELDQLKQISQEHCALRASACEAQARVRSLRAELAAAARQCEEMDACHRSEVKALETELCEVHSRGAALCEVASRSTRGVRTWAQHYKDLQREQELQIEQKDSQIRRLKLQLEQAQDDACSQRSDVCSKCTSVSPRSSLKSFKRSSMKTYKCPSKSGRASEQPSCSSPSYVSRVRQRRSIIDTSEMESPPPMSSQWTSWMTKFFCEHRLFPGTRDACVQRPERQDAYGSTDCNEPSPLSDCQSQCHRGQERHIRTMSIHPSTEDAIVQMPLRQHASGNTDSTSDVCPSSPDCRLQCQVGQARRVLDMPDSKTQDAIVQIPVRKHAYGNTDSTSDVCPPPSSPDCRSQCQVGQARRVHNIPVSKTRDAIVQRPERQHASGSIGSTSDVCPSPPDCRSQCRVKLVRRALDIPVSKTQDAIVQRPVIQHSYSNTESASDVCPPSPDCQSQCQVGQARRVLNIPPVCPGSQDESSQRSERQEAGGNPDSESHSTRNCRRCHTRIAHVRIHPTPRAMFGGSVEDVLTRVESAGAALTDSLRRWKRHGSLHRP